MNTNNIAINDSLQIDLAEAQRFLKMLDPATDECTFQTFDDSDEKRPHLARVFHGTLEQYASSLSRLNERGAGIFVTINQTDLHGRKAENITMVRKYFLDTDGAPIEPIKNAAQTGKIMPSCLVESSHGNTHVYFNADCKLDEFTPIQSALANKFGTDKSVIDLPRVLRLPGFYHQKIKNGIYRHECGPFRVCIIKIWDNAAAYTPDQMIQGLGLEVGKAIAPRTLPGNLTLGANLKTPPPPETPEAIERVKAMLEAVSADCDYGQWRDVVWAVAATGWHCGEALAREWSASAPDKFDESEFQKLWNSFNPVGGIGIGTLHHYAEKHSYQQTEEVRFSGSGEDVENGRLFANTWRGKMLFVHETGNVLLFDAAAGWIIAPPGETDRAAKQVLNKMHEEASARYKAAPDDPKTKRLMAQVTRTSRAQNLRAMIAMAASESGMTKSLNEFDADPMQLGVVNGVIDLRSGKLLPVSSGLLVTKRCTVTYDQGATCPQWERFLAEVQPVPDIREFIQRWAGYGLTGSVQEQKFVFLHGSGANGKSVFVELIAWLLGDYAKKIATEMLMQHQRSPQAASPDIVSLKGRRFVYANETEEGRKLAEARVKEMTGGDTLTGRVPYGKVDLTFPPTHKLAIVGNHKPEIGDSSNGMWRRVCLVEFNVTIEEKLRDPKLLEKLKAEGPGILNWLLAGLNKWQQGGLSIPKKIEAATAAYRDEQDTIGEWLREDCNTGQGLTAKKDELYRAYHTWALKNGHHPLAQKRLTRRLGERGFPALPDKRSLGGLALNQHGMMAVR